MVKNFISLFFAVIILISSNTASAEVYNVEESDMSIFMPDNFKTFTRTVSEDDPNLEMFSSKSALLSQMKDSDIYVLSYSPDELDEITVVIKENADSQEMYNLSRFSDGKIKQISKQTAELNEDTDKCTLYKSDTLPFIKTEQSTIAKDNVIVFSETYTTVVNGKNITVSWNSYDSNLTDDEQIQLKQIIDSISFSQILSGGKLDYNKLKKNCIAAAAVIAAAVLIATVVIKRKMPEKEKNVYSQPVYEVPAEEPALTDAEYKPQIAVHMLDETFGYSLANKDDVGEFANDVTDNTLYLHTYIDDNGNEKTEAMQYSAWMVLKRRHDESHFAD